MQCNTAGTSDTSEHVSHCRAYLVTWWTPGRNASHKLDYMAISSSATRRMRRCVISTVLGKPWQATSVRNQWPFKVRVRLRQIWPTTTSAEQKTARWNILSQEFQTALVSSFFLSHAARSDLLLANLDIRHCGRA